MTGSERTIFLEALDKEDPAERAAYLERACGANAELRRRVERLLEALDSAGSFMEAPAAPAEMGAINEGLQPILEGPGTRIGPYKLLEPIGEGGMGVVYMAEQTEPVRRKVALKIIKPGMDSAQVIARFEAERQALAMMDHPNIAKVLDAGATGTGRPYFVMELVKGVPITEFCDRNRLSLKERLELFAPVCRAIQHAHQKKIIHRDIKPSNVLVTLYDGTPVPKVIDFGVAKAIDQPLTERTLFTRFGAIIGTLEYMSPEQAELGSLDVDTRSDVYSLGVLLYELLTGTTPLERAELRRSAYSEILRKIREEEPPRPSARLSESREVLPSISEQRKAEPARLPKQVRGELDWIVMKALEKDRVRRYGSANGLALDVERYLRNEAVAAGPPSAAYRLRKRVRRLALAPRTLAVALVVMLTFLALGSFLTALSWVVARTRAQEAMRHAEMARMQAEVAAARMSAAAQAAQQVAVASGAPAARPVLDFFRAHQLSVDPNPGDRDQPRLNAPSPAALSSAEAALDATPPPDPAVEATIRSVLGETYLGLGEPKKAIRQFDRALALRRESPGRDDRATLWTMRRLADAYLQGGQVDRARPLYEEALSRGKAVLGTDDYDVMTFMNNLGRAYLLTEPILAEPVLREALASWTRHPNYPDHWHTAEAMSLMGGFLLARKDYVAAEPLLVQGYEGLKAREERIPGPSRWKVGEARRRVIQLYEAWGKPEKAGEWRKR
jgi:serine/threonine protein kinase